MTVGSFRRAGWDQVRADGPLHPNRHDLGDVYGGIPRRGDTGRWRRRDVNPRNVLDVKVSPTMQQSMLIAQTVLQYEQNQLTGCDRKPHGTLGH